jgi:hypothetical protein
LIPENQHLHENAFDPSRAADGSARFLVRLALVASFFLCECMAATPAPIRSETPLTAIPDIPDDKFWSTDDWITPIENRLANNQIRARSVLAPKYVDRRTATSVPAYIVQSGPFDEFKFGNFAEEGYFVLVDQDRNSLRLCPIHREMDEPANPRRKGPRKPGAAIHTVQSSGLNLSGNCIQDLPRTTSRFRVQGILPLTATNTFPFRVGGNPKDFDHDLSASLARIPDRKTLPPELLQEDPPWKTMAASPSLPEGLRASIMTESGRSLLEVDFALPELKGERLHLDPDIVLPTGNRAPEAVKWVHVLAAGEDHMHPSKVLLPVVGGAQAPLVRGHAKIDLGRLFPGMASTDFQSVYVFSGAAAVGPLELPGRKP